MQRPLNLQHFTEAHWKVKIRLNCSASAKSGKSLAGLADSDYFCAFWHVCESLVFPGMTHISGIVFFFKGMRKSKKLHFIRCGVWEQGPGPSLPSYAHRFLTIIHSRQHVHPVPSRAVWRMIASLWLERGGRVDVPKWIWLPDDSVTFELSTSSKLWVQRGHTVMLLQTEICWKKTPRHGRRYWFFSNSLMLSMQCGIPWPK